MEIYFRDDRNDSYDLKLAYSYMNGDFDMNKVYLILYEEQRQMDSIDKILANVHPKSRKIRTNKINIKFIESNFYKFVFYLHDLEKSKAK